LAIRALRAHGRRVKHPVRIHDLCRRSSGGPVRRSDERRNMMPEVGCLSWPRQGGWWFPCRPVGGDPGECSSPPAGRAGRAARAGTSWLRGAGRRHSRPSVRRTTRADLAPFNITSIFEPVAGLQYYWQTTTFRCTANSKQPWAIHQPRR
jgi:hypothetical protein